MVRAAIGVRVVVATISVQMCQLITGEPRLGSMRWAHTGSSNDSYCCWRRRFHSHGYNNGCPVIQSVVSEGLWDRIALETMVPTWLLVPDEVTL